MADHNAKELIQTHGFTTGLEISNVLTALNMGMHVDQERVNAAKALLRLQARRDNQQRNKGGDKPCPTPPDENR